MRKSELLQGNEACVKGALETGDEMELVIEKITQDDEGNDIIGYKFKPVER